MKAITIALLGISVIPALPLFAQVDGTTDTDNFPAAVQTAATTCKMAAGITCKGTECPSCTVTTSSTTGYVRAGLVFPDGKLTCVFVHGTVVDAFDNLSTDRALNFRVVWDQLSGGNGMCFGGQCTGQCFKLQVSAAYQTEGVKLDTMPFSAPIETDWMANQNGGFGRKNTGTARGVNRDLAARRTPVVFKVCRDARPTNANDKLAGSIRVLWTLTAWPILNHTTIAPTAATAVDSDN